jgi:hypothetical protein
METDKSKNLIQLLLGKSQEAFIIGIEIYNKPTIRYRVEGFSFFICNAWELMLKAYLIKTKGEKSIYYAKDEKRTITLSNCIEQIFTNKNDPLRMNLERIIELRNTSTHFITEEYEQIYVPFFQSCVLNYCDKMLTFFDVDVTDKIPANFLTLSIKVSSIEPKEIQARYPKLIAEQLLETLTHINNSVPEEGNEKYAILIKHDIYLTKKKEIASASVAISKDADQAAFIFKNVKDWQQTCPHRRKKCIELINKEIKKNNINFINPTKDPSDDKYHTFNTSHFDLIVKFYNMKSNKEYCYIYDRGTTPQFTYSNSAIEFIFSEIKKDPENIIQNLKKQIKKS